MDQINAELSIIVVNFQSEKAIEGCLASIFKSIVPQVKTEIIVVNNDISGKLKSLEHRYPGIVTIESSGNIGFGAASNLGAAAAKGKIFLFLNPDTEIISDKIELVLGMFFKNDLIGVIGSRIVTPDKKTQPWSTGYETSLADIIQNNLGFSRSRKIWKAKQARTVNWVSGTALFIRQEIFKKVFGFDENFFMYFEDVDLCRRVRKLGAEVLYLPGFSVLHFGSGSYKSLKKQKQHYYESQARYFKKHRGKAEQMLLGLARKFF